MLRIKVVMHTAAQTLLNMEAVAFLNMGQVQTQMDLAVLDQVRLKRHTLLTVRVMLQLQAWAAPQFLNILLNLQVQNPFGGLNHNKS